MPDFTTGSTMFCVWRIKYPYTLAFGKGRKAKYMGLFFKFMITSERLHKCRYNTLNIGHWRMFLPKNCKNCDNAKFNGYQ